MDTDGLESVPSCASTSSWIAATAKSALLPSPGDTSDVLQISWFLIPGAELAKQQHQVLVNALPPVGVTLLTGASGVDKWSNKETWDELLKTPVIITTHQVCRPSPLL